MAHEKFPISIVDDLDLPWAAIHDEHDRHDDKRLAEWRFCIFEYEGRLWRLHYMQTLYDGIYWNGIDRRPEFVRCVEVEPQIVEITKWVEKA